MDLILWRHAEAENGIDDLQRPLSAKGHQQAKIMGKWLKSQLAKPTQIWVSEALRSQQTAAYFSNKTTIQPRLNPSAPMDDIIKLLYESHWQKNLIIVGHQPWIGQLSIQLLTSSFNKEKTNCSIKKSAIWWFEMKADHQSIRAKLKIMLPPSHLQNDTRK